MTTDRGSAYNESGDCCVSKAFFDVCGYQSQTNKLPQCDNINMKYKCEKIECEDAPSDTGTCKTGICTVPNVIDVHGHTTYFQNCVHIPYL